MSQLPRNATVESMRKRASALVGKGAHEQARDHETLASALETELKKLRQLVHVAKRELIQKGTLRNDDDYRTLLAQATETQPGTLNGKQSTGDMHTLGELEAVMKALRAKGFKVRHAKAGGGKSRPLEQAPQDTKLRALWLDMHKQGVVADAGEEALAQWIKREFGVDALQWLTSAQCAQAIERLKQWQSRVLAQENRLRITGFGLPGTFPDFMVPDEAAKFCAETNGTAFKDAQELARQRGYAPLVKRLPKIGENVWGFALTVDGLGIPFMVTLGE